MLESPIMSDVNQTQYVLSGSTNFSTCWLITSLHKQHCKIGPQMLKYRNLNLYAVQRKRMKSGGLPGTSVPCSFNGLINQHLRSESNFMPSPCHDTFTCEGKMWEQESLSTQEAGGLLFTTLALDLCSPTVYVCPPLKGFPRHRTFNCKTKTVPNTKAVDQHLGPYGTSVV